MAKVKSASLTLFVSATSTPRHGTRDFSCDFSCHLCCRSD
ncbi:unnamed protein product [Brassica napus]|uniref:(rape) hypothetical protein n=1 Tax=Brassica napus TaxID=3708 RepID=A0A816XP96_BRANA|nr:unnamed protein product [Brassica napus]